ncbi:MAG: LysM domain-containing protein [Planctomycetota bacterium]|nr:LysM domain-containing protein [Planctomycetota bacterium]MDA1113585.1 LysM domain-containing protein [Planctomycetota bacterium]
MGRLEKQIIIGALALVGVLLGVVVVKGLKPRDTEDTRPPLFIDLDPAAGMELEPKEDSVFPSFPPSPGDKGKQVAKTPKETVTPPVERIQPPDLPKADQPRLYTIQKHDTLSEIAQEQLGSQRRMQEILDANPGLDVKHLVPGETLVLPGKNSGAAAAKVEKDSGKAVEAVAGRRTHTVSAGDSLWSLAEKYYGKGFKVDRIVSANPKLLPDKNTVLNIGWVLVIPE